MITSKIFLVANCLANSLFEANLIDFLCRLIYIKYQLYYYCEALCTKKLALVSILLRERKRL